MDDMGMAARNETLAADVTRAFFAAMVEGDVERASALLDDKCVIDTAGGLPFSGIFVGREGFRKFLRGIPSELSSSLHDVNVVGIDDLAVARLNVRFEARKTGASIEVAVVELHTVVDHRIVAVDAYYKNATMIRSLVEEGAV